MSSTNFLFNGLVSGLFASLILIFAFWGIWLLPALGLILTRVNLTNGAMVAAFFGIIGGLVFSLFVREKRLNIKQRFLAGSILGFGFWVGGVLALVPIMLGFPPVLKSPQDHIFTLIIFVVYGISLAFIYHAFATRKS